MPDSNDFRVIGVIPARYDSERLPGKVLRPIAGKAMVHLVYERARTSALLSELYVATDSELVREYCQKHGLPVLITASTHRSGTERILEVMRTTTADVYVNVQGDEPMITAEHLDLLIEPLVRDANQMVSTLKTPLEPQEAENPNIVKVVTDSQ